MHLKFMFSKKATQFDEIFTSNLTLCSKCQIAGEDFVYFCGLLRKHELYLKHNGLLNVALWHYHLSATILQIGIFLNILP